MSETDTTAAPEAAPVVPSSEVPAAEAAPSPADAPLTPEEPGESDTQDQDRKPKQKAAERIGELYGRMKSMELERDAAVQELQRLQKPLVDPNQWDQMSYDQQQAAQLRYAVRQERAEELAQEAHRRDADVHAARAEMFSQRVSSVRQQIPDIETVLNDPTLPVSEIGARFITESDKGPHVGYWLGQNRAEAARIARLEPLAQAYELGRIEARISAAPASRKLSTAPAPVPKVGGGANAGAKDPASMNMSEYIEWTKKRG